ncbi:N-terminal domain of NEFA-interacting nuclear protein NIP30-domain-containing protein [Earliella scabrosa]|nr:N-terminal domain of NEFA-interacting nuclear protein NIP30-domain-containing protein [Earliella scabrosa]
MDDAIPSISTVGVGSRFVSQDELEAAKARRDEQWRAAYARLGQEPPPQPQEDAFDGRSLAEKLAANRAAKQEEWEERNKLGNQFRALEEDEVLFLDSVLEKQREEERLRKEMEGEELKHFREAVAARENAANKPPPIGAASAASSSSSAPPKVKPAAAPAKKDPKKSLKGVLVKKRSKPIASDAQESTTKADNTKTSEGTESVERQAKRRKVLAS